MDEQQLEAWQHAALQRLLRYVAVDTTAQPGQPSPSSAGQLILGGQIVAELRGLGLDRVSQDQYGIVTATLPATPGHESAPTIGWLAHLDTSPDAPGADVGPRVVERYDGGTIEFAGRAGLTIDPGRCRSCRAASATTSSSPTGGRCSAPTTSPARPRS